jgi:hypothetical protein
MLPVNTDEGGLVFVSVRDICYEDAEAEIRKYIRGIGSRTVYVSELAEELQIDIDLIKSILKRISN